VAPCCVESLAIHTSVLVIAACTVIDPLVAVFPKRVFVVRVTCEELTAINLGCFNQSEQSKW